MIDKVKIKFNVTLILLIYSVIGLFITIFLIPIFGKLFFSNEIDSGKNWFKYFIFTLTTLFFMISLINCINCIIVLKKKEDVSVSFHKIMFWFCIISSVTLQLGIIPMICAFFLKKEEAIN